MGTYTYKQFTRTRAELKVLEETDVAPPGALLIPIIRNLRHINAALRDYDEAIQRVIQEIGQPTPRGWMIPEDDPAAQRIFYQEQQDMLNTEVEVDIHPIGISRFIQAMRKKDGFEVPLRTLVRLDYLIELDVDDLPPDSAPDKGNDE